MCGEKRDRADRLWLVCLLILSQAEVMHHISTSLHEKDHYNGVMAGIQLPESLMNDSYESRLFKGFVTSQQRLQGRCRPLMAIEPSCPCVFYGRGITAGRCRSLGRYCLNLVVKLAL